MKSEHPNPKSALNPFEKLLRYVLAVLAAHYIVVNGTTQSFIDLLLIRGYYVEMGFSIAVAFILVTWVNYVNVRLDRRYGWEKNIAERITWQVLLGFMVPALVEFFLVAIYFKVLGNINILETRFIKNEYRIVLIMICFFNLYCVARYFYHQWRVTREEFDAYKNLVPIDKYSGTDTFTALLNEDSNHVAPVVQENPKREIFIVQTTVRTIPVKMEDICSFYRANGCYYLRAYNQTVNEAYIIPQTLKEVEELIDPLRFFRINRKMIISFDSFVSYRQGNGKMLELVVNPSHVDTENGTKELPFVVVSEDRVKAFKAWIDR